MERGVRNELERARLCYFVENKNKIHQRYRDPLNQLANWHFGHVFSIVFSTGSAD